MLLLQKLDAPMLGGTIVPNKPCDYFESAVRDGSRVVHCKGYRVALSGRMAQNGLLHDGCDDAAEWADHIGVVFRRVSAITITLSCQPDCHVEWMVIFVLGHLPSSL